LAFRVGSAARCSLGNVATFELRGDAKHGKDKLGKIGSRIDDRLGKRTQSRAGRCRVSLP
jgi:hypothetical protein